jgi:hypothetical protein
MMYVQDFSLNFLKLQKADFFFKKKGSIEPVLLNDAFQRRLLTESFPRPLPPLD